MQMMQEMALFIHRQIRIIALKNSKTKTNATICWCNLAISSNRFAYRLHLSTRRIWIKLLVMHIHCNKPNFNNKINEKYVKLFDYTEKLQKFIPTDIMTKLTWIILKKTNQVYV